MKSKTISVVILSITLFFSIILILVSSGLSKRNINTEWITFSGDLYGEQEVVGCCGNAGPNPEYTLTLSEEAFPDDMTREPHTGLIFMNRFGRNMPWAYMVQFSWTDSGKEYYIEIRGGVIHQDKKTKILTVDFDDPCEIQIDGNPYLTVPVIFTLTRDPHHPAKK
ncbi:MAG: hypothetical protein ACFFD5_13630 [Candidatus Thorarchaeota archaeon]